MPRIPVRTEPYSSPSRQHRHFKNKRDQVLRALGKAAYINGSHFAIMWVTASGQAETYASDAFQGRLEDWFDKTGIKDEAKKLIQERDGGESRRGSKAGASQSQTADEPAGGLSGDEDGEEGDDDDEGGADDAFLDFPGFQPHTQQGENEQASRSVVHNSSHNTPLITCDDVFGGGPVTAFQGATATASTTNAQNNLAHAAATKRLNRKPLAPLDISSANLQFARSQGLLQPGGAADDDFMRAPMSAPLPNHDKHQRHLPRAPMSRAPSGSNSAKLFEVSLADRAARTAFFELRFSQMQQGMCKTVAKAWIKIIEPKKQTRCPYNKGEEGKPEWWPEGVRHKEPDHLMKPERHALLLTILRSPKIKVARLQLATAEVVAMIRADKVNLLMDVYRIAREEERLREEGKDNADDAPVTVSVSTLDGWKVGGDGEKAGLDEEGKRATMGDDTPESEEKQRRKQASKKRTLSQAMARSVSTSAVPGVDKKSKRTPMIDLRPDSMKRNPDAPSMARSFTSSALIGARHAQTNAASASSSPSLQYTTGPLQHHQGMGAMGAVNEGSLRKQATSSAAAASAAVAVAGLSYGAGHRGQHYEQIPDYMSRQQPSFEQGYALSLQNQRMQQPHPGSMSAPQGPCPPLYPAAHPPPHQLQHQSQHGSTSATNSPAMGYDYHFNPGFVNPFESPMAQQQQGQQDQQQLPNGMADQPDDTAGGALGLHGLPVPTSIAWTNPFEEVSAHSFDGAQEPWHTPQSIHQQQEQLMRAQFAPPGSAPARISALPSDDSMGDLSLDRSFASASTNGPATPPQGGGLNLQLGRSVPAKSMQQHQQMNHHQQAQVASGDLSLAGLYAGSRGQMGPFDSWTTDA